MKVLFVEGEPVPKARPRMGKGGNVFTPRTTTAAEKKIRAAWVAEYGAEPEDGPVQIVLTFRYPPLNGWPKWKKEAAAEKRISKATKPDIDNLAKTVMDALNGIAYTDDSRVAWLSAKKCYTTEPQGTLIEVFPVPEPKRKTQADIIEEGRWF